MTGNLKLFELKKLEDTRMKIVIINGSARKGNTLTAINAFIKGEPVVCFQAGIAYRPPFEYQLRTAE